MLICYLMQNLYDVEKLTIFFPRSNVCVHLYHIHNLYPNPHISQNEYIVIFLLTDEAINMKCQYGRKASVI